MNRAIPLGPAMLAGGAIGATAVNGLHAQGSAPAAYAIVDISAVTNPDVFKTLLPKAGPAMAAFGGKYIIRTDKITMSMVRLPHDLSSSRSTALRKHKPLMILQRRKR
jgi:hypothetical protein